MTSIDPQRTYALVVGVEKYEAGSDLSIRGPNSDAIGIMKWLVRNDVPPRQILALLSPLNATDFSQLAGIQPSEPTSANASEALIRKLPNCDGDLLLVFWSGHGIIKIDQKRRLVCADATDRHLPCLNLDDALAFYRSSLVKRFAKQIWLVDACANYAEHLALANVITDIPFPGSIPVEDREQFLLMGAQRGQVSKNLDEERTGLFSRELLKVLSATVWPPNMTGVTEVLCRQFERLRSEGRADQSPSYLHYRDWSGNEGSLGTSSSVVIQRASVAPPKLPAVALRALAGALLECRSVRDARTRDAILDLMRPAIRNNTKRSDMAKLDVLNLVSTSADYTGGIRELLEVVGFFEEESTSIEQVFKAGHSFLAADSGS